MAHAGDKITGVRHVYVCPMRWADLDMLGHVNNVTYVDYLQEARVDMLRLHGHTQDGEELADGVVVVRHEIAFVAPLALAETVTVECWVTEVRAATFTMAYEIVSLDPDGTRTVHLRASTVLSPFVFAEERPRRITAEEKAALLEHLDAPLQAVERLPRTPGAEAHDYPLHVRWSDVDAYGHVNNVKYVEYFQEARIRYMSSLPRPEDGPWTHWVVATTGIEYRRPILFRAEPYAVRSWITRVGNKSLEILNEVRDGDVVLARAKVVLVAFDPSTQRSTEMNPRQRDRLLSQVAAPAGT